LFNRVARNYAGAFPDMGIRIFEFFHISNATSDAGWAPRRIIDFIQTLPTDTEIGVPQPYIIDEMCRTLCRASLLSEAGTDARLSLMGAGNRYHAGGPIQTDPVLRDLMGQYFNCIIFGFPWIYDQLGQSVLPIAHVSRENGVSSLGTVFVTGPSTLLTASHCVTGASSLAIRDVERDALASARFYVSKSDAIDLAQIEFPGRPFEGKPPIYPEEPAILDEVMALGYPDVSGFIPALAAEKAAISAHLSAVRGTVASTPLEIWAREALLLITARVRGGFSGGPVLNEKGQYVGIVSRGAHNEVSDNAASAVHQYDNLGYGTVIPEPVIRSFLEDIGNRRLELATRLDTAHVSFSNFAP
jgi:serine protease Do